MKETLKPIDLEKPLCGLGEDYEPEILFMPIYRLGACQRIENIILEHLTVVVFKAMADCPQPAICIECKTIQEIRANAKAGDRSISLLDADLNIIKTWPV